ncbi:TolC family protein [Pseudomaricurvus alkylphenolicus]|uniref:TolC family protein n=1 Tax=Pseudomaricurvus alkylphenolicus TaxID=1306991 RepID=UPI001F110258|nr:TolC family protein [Pseudomaricurvus alkylphenolicus]
MQNTEQVSRHINTSIALTLEDAITRTLKNNPQLYQYRFRQQSLIAQRETSSLSPALQLGLEVENVAGSGEFNEVDSAETTLALSSVIELGAKARSRAAVIDARADRLNFERQAATLDVLGELTTTFIRALSTQENIALAKEAFALSEQMLKTVKQRASKGAAPEAEVMRAKAALTRTFIRLQALRSSFKRQKVTLSSFWGGTNPHFTELSGSLSAFGSSDDFASLLQRAKHSPAIAIFASEARLKDAEVKLAQAQSRVDIGWQLGVRRFEETDDTALTAGVSIPLFSGKRNRGAVASALAERNAVDYQQADAQLRLHNRLFAAYSQREENKAAVKQFSSHVLPALEQALRLTRQAYENGRYRYQDWIAAQEELLTAKQQHIEAATAAQLNQALIEQLIAEPLATNDLSY